jgi:hypothetical protein
MQFGALQIKLPAFPPTSKVIFSMLHSSVRRLLVRTLGLNCALKRSKQNILGLLGSKLILSK